MPRMTPGTLFVHSRRHVAISALLGLTAALLAWFAGTLPLSRRIEDQTYDWRLRATARPSEARSDIVLVLINESSLRALAPRFGAWPWPRFLHAGVIDFLTRAHARVIAYDVLFTERDLRSFSLDGQTMTGQDSDAELVASVKRSGNVVLLADALFQGLEQASVTVGADQAPNLPGVAYAPGEGFESRPSIRLPFPELASAALAIGHNFEVKEATGQAARRAWPFVESQHVAVPSLGLAAVLAAERVPRDDVRIEGNALRIAARHMPLLAEPAPARTGETPQPSRQVLLNFHGPFETLAGRPTYPNYSFFDVLLSENNISSGEKPAVDPSVFRDKIVFVGTSADGLFDTWSTPFGGGGMPGAQLHAALADDVLSNRFMKRAPPATEAGTTVGAGLAGGALATLLPVAWAVGAVLAVAVALAVWLTHEIGAGVWIGIVTPMAALALALFEGVAWQYFVEGREKRQVKRLFGRYVSKDVFEHLMADPTLARLGGERRDMTVLFSDIRGFTSASERGTPEAIVHQLNEYFSAMVEVLFRHRGTLDKFVGDMVMGLFGAPVADPRHADHAVAAAVEMASVLDRLNERWEAAGRPRLDIGIGINSGDMIAGNIGSETIMSYTVIGDAVNLGARLESLNKDYGTRILISEATRSRLTLPVKTRPIGEVTVKGRTQAVMVHEVTQKEHVS